jgi:hypothetical protein
MAQSVGDAVLTFLGDTTNLDQAFAIVASGAEKSMSAAADSVGQVSDSLHDISFELDATASNAAYAGGEIKEAMNKAAVATGEARGEAMLLGEAFGVHLPRHVTSFVATLPGVGEALEGAFAATAVLFLIDALVKGSEKLSQWVANTFIFTQAMKDSDQSVKDQNKSLILLAAQIDQDKQALSNFGKTQAEIKSDKVAALTAAIKDNEAKFATAKVAAAAYATAVKLSKPEEAAEQLGKLNGVLGSVASAFAKVAVEEKSVFDSIKAFFTGGKNPAELAAEAQKAGMAAQVATIQTSQTIIDEKVKLALAVKELTVQEIADQEAAAKESISNSETVGMARIQVWAADAKYQAAFAKDAAAATLKVEQEQAEKEYQLKLQTLQKEKAAEQSAATAYSKVSHDPQTDEELTLKKDAALKEEALVKSTNAKIEALDAEHYAKEKQIATAGDEAILKLHADAAVLASAVAKGFFPSLPADTRDLLSMDDAAKKLGVTLSKNLEKGANEARSALALLDKEYKGGQISLRDYQQAQMGALAAQIAYDKEIGVAPKLIAAEQHAYDLLKASVDKVYASEKQEKTFWDGFSTEFAKKAKNVGDEAQAMGQMMANAAAQMDQAFASAIMGALKSGQSIGAALEKATAEVLINLATQAGAHALYCTAMGIAELALGVTSSSAAEWFTAAAEFGLVAGAAGGAGIAMSGGSGGGGSKGNNVSGSSNPGGVGQSSSSGGGVNQTGTVPKLATGGIVSNRTMFMAGDSPSGGDAEEAIVPLSDPSALAKISNALAMRAPSAAMTSSAAAVASASAPSSDANSGGGAGDSSSGGGGGDTHLHLNVKGGVLDSGTLKKTMTKYQRMLQQNRANFTSSNSLRVTKRSQ